MDQSRTFLDVTAGAAYLIRVSGFGGAFGDFVLTVALAPPPPPCHDGPDLIVADLIDMPLWGQTAGVTAYSVGTDACNIGCAPASWIAATPRHPVIAQNMYRLFDGRFEQIGMSWLKHSFSSSNDSTWRYEYAVQNLNSDRSAGAFSVPLAPGANIFNAGFHAPFYHSGEPYANAAWTAAVAGGILTFATEPYKINVNANALRWSTLYNFRFDASVAPVVGLAIIGLFKPGVPSMVTVALIPVPGRACPRVADGDMNGDGASDGQDIQPFVAAVLSASTSPADRCPGDINGNGAVDAFDLPDFVGVFLAQ